MSRVDRFPGRSFPGRRLLLLASAPVLWAAVLLIMTLPACGGGEAPPPTATALPAATEPPATSAPAAVETHTPEGPATQTPEPTATPQPTATPEPTATLEPTATPQPTATPEPTETPQPSIIAPGGIQTEAPAESAASCQGTAGGQVGNCAPELQGTQDWINSEPLTMQELRGKVVLVDFWTYSCINCIRTLPFLREWHDRYAEQGLVILGVHTPEFEFEEVYDNVVQATIDEGVAWPVVQDNDYRVWSSYSNRFWPAKYLIDGNGVIQYRHFGEGRYAETEQEIRRLLQEAGARVNLTLPLPEDQRRAGSPGDTALNENEGRRTPELFAGWSFVVSHFQAGRGLYVGQVDPYNNNRDEVVELEIPGEIYPDRIYFKGSWYIGRESVRHARETEDYSDSVVLGYSSRSVNAVLASESGEPYRVRVKVEGQYLTEENKGEDIIIGEDGESYLVVTTPRAYKIVEHPAWMQHQVLELFTMSNDFDLFSFTFGTYEDGF